MIIYKLEEKNATLSSSNVFTYPRSNCFLTLFCEVVFVGSIHVTHDVSALGQNTMLLFLVHLK
jgi:hypothetical protein